jgi:hypothetical protein
VTTELTILSTTATSIGPALPLLCTATRMNMSTSIHLPPHLYDPGCNYSPQPPSASTTLRGVIVFQSPPPSTHPLYLLNGCQSNSKTIQSMKPTSIPGSTAFLPHTLVTTSRCHPSIPETHSATASRTTSISFQRTAWLPAHHGDIALAWFRTLLWAPYPESGPPKSPNTENGS